MLLQTLLIAAALANPDADVDAAWKTRAYEDTEGGRLAHAQAFLRDFGPSADLEQRIIAHVTIGRILWRRSCRDPRGCFRYPESSASASSSAERRWMPKRRPSFKRKLPARCGTHRQPFAIVVPRKAARVRKAQRHLASALELADALPSASTRAAEVDEAVSWARLLSLEPRFEAHARFELPPLGFYIEHWKQGSQVSKWEQQYVAQKKRHDRSEESLSEFLSARQAEGTKLAEAYRVVAAMSAIEPSLWAMERIAQIHETTADGLYRAARPRTIRHEEAYWAYCDALSVPAESYATAAADAYAECLDHAVERGALVGPALRCEEHLEQRFSDRYPPTLELFGLPVYERGKMASYAVQLEPEPERPAVILHDVQ